MNEDEKRAYQRGYAAGRSKAKQDRRSQRERQAFWDRAFLAAIPACLQAENWWRGEKPIRTLDERMKLACDAADEAVECRREVK